jgi:two-component system, NarL family, nitrate/nitrite response regulator NarL
MRQRRAHSALQIEDRRSGFRERPKPSLDRSKRLARRLTNRRRQVATLVCRGLSNRAIAERLDVTEGTVKVHLHAIYEKLNIHSRTKLAIALINRSGSKRA